MENLKNRHALVCGASRGIGRAAAVELAKQGCQITALARSEKDLKATLDLLPGEGHRLLAADLGKAEDLKRVLETLKDPVHILICNSGGPASGPLVDADIEQFENAFRQHLFANHRLVQHLWKGMRDAGYGRIITVLSTSVKAPLHNLGVSNTLRGAMANWAKTLANELGPYGITVNNVLPGATETDRLRSLLEKAMTTSGKTEDEVRKSWADAIPVRRVGRPEELGAAIAFLAGPQAGYINGINLPVDGGRLAPL